MREKTRRTGELQSCEGAPKAPPVNDAKPIGAVLESMKAHAADFSPMTREQFIRAVGQDSEQTEAEMRSKANQLIHYHPKGQAKRPDWRNAHNDPNLTQIEYPHYTLLVDTTTGEVIASKTRPRVALAKSRYVVPS